MPARLSLHPPHQPTKILLAREERDYLIGRDPSCDLAVDDDRISRQHARLSAADGRWVLTDLDSKNGTAVDGLPVAESSLADGSWLSFGGLVGRFEVLTEEEGRRIAESERRRWHSSLEAQRALTPSLGIEELLRRVLASFLELSGGERGFVMLAGPDGDLEISAAGGVEPEELAAREFKGSVGAIRRALAESRAVAASDALADSGLAARASVAAGGIRALVCVPLRALDRVIGVIYADSRRPGASFDELDLEILEALASHAALAIAVARIDQELRVLAAALPARPGFEAGPAESLAREVADLAWRSVPSYRQPREAAARAPRRGATTWSGLLALHGAELEVAG